MGRGDTSGVLDASSESIYMSRAVFAGAAAYGHDPLALARRLGVAAELLGDPDARLPARLAVQIWHEVPRIVGDDLFGVHLAEHASVGTIPVLGYLVRSSATLLEGMHRALRYQRLVQNMNHVDFAVGATEARLHIDVRSDDPEILHHAIDFCFGLTVRIARELVELNVTPTRVRFKHAAPARASGYGGLFGDDVAFGATDNEMWFARADLDVPLATLDPNLGELLERHARALLTRVPEGSRTTHHVRAAIVDALRAGAPSLEGVARALRISARTLQRRLRSEGTSVADLVDDIRRDLARRYVADPSLALAEAAHLLGFSDQAAFHRAFVRWNGSPPGAWRKLRAAAL